MQMTFKMNENETRAMLEALNFDKLGGLIPAIIQDASNDLVLMQGFMNREALKLTLATGMVHFWSRSKKRLWLKGEESGHHSLVENIAVDCDNDSILLKVQQIGPCCHTGESTCFHKSHLEAVKPELDGRILNKLESIITERIEKPTAESYVASLVARGKSEIQRKIGEESLELILAQQHGSSREIIAEAADVIFHLLILLRSENLPVSEVFKELGQRHIAKTKVPSQP